MIQEIDINHTFKFDGSYFNIWKHRLTLIFQGIEFMDHNN